MSIPGDPDSLREIEVLSAVHRQLSDAVADLADASARSNALAGQTDWRTDAATRFHEAAQSWHRDVSRLSDLVDVVRDEVARAWTLAQVGGGLSGG